MTSLDKAWQVDYDEARGTLLALRGKGAEWQLRRLASLVDDLAERFEAMERRPVDYAIGPAELDRKRTALAALRRDAEAAQVIGAPGDSPVEGGGGGFAQGGNVSRLEQQRETMREHDRMLSDLGRGVNRLKTQTSLINEETSLHVRLLDDMEGDADRASSGLRNEARRAEKIREKSKIFNLYVIIIVLSVVLAILIFAGV